jgi:hypothetical protein
MVLTLEEGSFTMCCGEPFYSVFWNFPEEFLIFNCLCLFELANRAKSLHDESPLVGFTGGSSPTAFY